MSDLVTGSYISVAPAVLNEPAAPAAPAVLLSKFQSTSVDEVAWSEPVASAATARISVRLVIFMVVESRAKDDLQRTGDTKQTGSLDAKTHATGNLHPYSLFGDTFYR